MKNPIDEHFERGLESLEFKPNAELWSQKIAPKLERKKVVPLFWYRTAAVIVLLLCGWFTAEYFTANNGEQRIEPEQNIAQEQTPEVLPQVVITITDEEKTEKEPKIPALENINQKLKKRRMIAVNEQPIKKEVVKDKAAPVQLAMAETEPTETVYKVHLSLNSIKNVMAVEEVEDQQQELGIVKYARDQWKNVKTGNKLEAPTRETFSSIPKLGVRFEGNPLKRILNN